jgi:hypothetical protein
MEICKVSAPRVLAGGVAMDTAQPGLGDDTEVVRVWMFVA